MTKRKRTACADMEFATMDSFTFNRLESLSNELLLDIFEYLDGYDLCQAFYGLNYRINTLLKSIQLHILHDSSKKNKRVWDTVTSFFNCSQIRILSSCDDINIDERFLSASNENLRTVRLHDTNHQYINKICQHFSTDNQIKCLSVRGKPKYSVGSDKCFANLLLVNHGHRFASLVHLSILSASWIQFPIVSVTFSQLRHLSIEQCYFSNNVLDFLQKNTPNLRSFKFTGTFDVITPSSIIVKHIQELHIDGSLDWFMLLGVLSNFPSLRRLHISWIYNRRTPIVNGTQWQQLIEQHIPQLKQLTIDFDQGVDEDILQTFYRNEFWLTKKIKAKMIMNKTESRYRLVKTISYGQEWHFRCFDNLWM